MTTNTRTHPDARATLWIVVDVLHEAIKDAVTTRQVSTNGWSARKALLHRIRACAWLVSTHATPWCDAAGMDQGWLMGSRGRWAPAARRLLREADEAGIEVPEDQRRVIEEGLERVG